MTSSTTTTQRFDRLVPNAACRLVDVNEHLLCALCSGYLVDATTIIECLHTFCRSCIIRYLESSETCPVCDVPLHQTNPLLGIRSDTTLQTLVYKLVPGVYKDEVKRRCTVINKAHADGKRPAPDAMARLLKDICDMTTGGRIYAGDEAFSVCLQYSASKQSTSSANSFKDLCSIDTGKNSCERTKQDLTDCSYLLCPASLTVAHLKKLIRSKLELGSHLPLELYHSSRDGSLCDGYTMADVAYITAWTSVKPLHFFYCVHAKSGSSNPNKAANPERNSPDDIQTPDSKSAIRSEQKRRKRFSPVSKGKLSTLTRVKPPPGKCLSTKRLTPRNVFPSTKSFSKEKKGVTQQERSCHSSGTTECVTKTVDIACVEEEEEEEDSVILLEEDTLDSYPVQTESGPAGDVVAGDPEVQEVNNVKRAFSAIAPDVGTSTNQRLVTECKNSADSALSPNRSDIVTQSTLTSDSSDMTTTTTSSDVEAFDVIDSASSPLPPKKKKKIKTSEIAGAVDRNLFAVINSMIVGTTDNNNSNSRSNNNDNVVSSSTSSSQVSADDGSDCGASKTSVETQTSVELLSSRKAKPNKVRSKKTPSLAKTARNKNADDANAELPRHPSSADVATAAAVAVAASAHTSSQQHISVSAHTFSSAAAAVTSCTSATLCVPICIGDKGSNLILNLPQNVSVQCRIRSDKILIASNPTAGNNPDTFGSISGNETPASDAAGKEGTALVQTHPIVPSTEGTSLLICSPPDAAGTGLVGTGTTVEGTSKERSRTKSIGAVLSDDGTCGHREISSNHTEHCQVPSDATPDKGLSRDRDTNTSASLSRSASLSCNVGSHGNTMATSSGHSFCSANAIRQPSLSSKSVLTNSVKPPLGVTAKPLAPTPAKTDLQKSVPKQKPVQSVLPNVAKISASTAQQPPIITPNTVDTPSTSTNKVVLFKPYQMTNTSETKPQKTEVLTGNAVIQPDRQSACTSYRSPQCTMYPSFTRPICTQDEDKQTGLSKDPLASGSAGQKGLSPAVHCTAGNVPFRNIIKVPVYTASCSQASRKPERKSTTAGSKFNQSSKDKGSFQEIPKNFEHLKKTSQTAVVTSLCANAVTKAETKESSSSSEQRTQIKNSLRVDLKLPVTSGSSETVEEGGGAGGGGGANLADASQSTCRKTQSLKRQNPEHLDAVSKSPRRRSDKMSVLDEMTYTRAEADSGTSPCAATGSPPPPPPRSGPSKNDEKKTGSQHQHHHRLSSDGSPVRRRTLVIDLERCSQDRPAYECISSRKKSTVEQRLQCCSPPQQQQQHQRPGGQARPARHTPPTKLVISLPRCQVSPTTTQSPPSSSSSSAGGGSDSPPPTTKRLKLMCNGMTIYRTLESPGSRSASAGGGVGSSGTRKSPVSAPILDCSSSKLSLFSGQKTTAHGKHRPKAAGHGDGPAAAVTVGVLPGSAVASVDSTSTSPRSGEAAASAASDTVPAWKGLERSVSLPSDPGSTEEPLELTTKVVKERQKEKDYERFMSSQRPTSAFTA